jgi:hypothetical protein
MFYKKRTYLGGNTKKRGGGGEKTKSNTKRTWVQYAKQHPKYTAAAATVTAAAILSGIAAVKHFSKTPVKEKEELSSIDKKNLSLEITELDDYAVELYKACAYTNSVNIYANHYNYLLQNFNIIKKLLQKEEDFRSMPEHTRKSMSTITRILNKLNPPK